MRLFIIALTYCLAWVHHRRREQLGDTSGAGRSVPGGAELQSSGTRGAGLQSCDPSEVAVALVTAKLPILAVACSEIAAYWTMHPPAGFAKMAEFVAAFTLVGAAIVWMGRHAAKRSSGVSEASFSRKGLFCCWRSSSRSPRWTPRWLQRARGGEPSRDRHAVRHGSPPQAARRAREDARAADWRPLHHRQPALAVDAHVRDQRALAAWLIVGDGDHLGAGDARRRVAWNRTTLVWLGGVAAKSGHGSSAAGC